MTSLFRLSHRLLAIGYAFLFFSVVIVGHLPGTTDAAGNLFGLFHIDPIDDLLHGFSGLWASFSAFRSRASSIFYFRWFGLYYTTDAFIGQFTGYSILDLVMGKWDANQGFVVTDFLGNFPINLPHFILGPVALYIGYLYNQPRGAKKK